MKRDRSLHSAFKLEIFKLWVLSLVVACGLFGGLVYWAFSAEIGGAVIASGRVTVESRVKNIQHSEGGYISEIFVDDGDRVEANQVLIRLDRTDAQTELAVVVDQLNATIAIEARLIAETGGFLPYLIAAEDMAFVTSGEKFSRFKQVQEKLLETSKASFLGRLQQIAEQISQIQF